MSGFGDNVVPTPTSHHQGGCPQRLAAVMEVVLQNLYAGQELEVLPSGPAVSLPQAAGLLDLDLPDLLYLIGEGTLPAHKVKGKHVLYVEDVLAYRNHWSIWSAVPPIQDDELPAE